ncbi:hypothetical protein HPB50_009242 [Hyalomma asiaticum]|uniref:Uncharacterized protein n=1 Tax=Hyalomma asiaticum TaxID=266040 RepID=A0ACB7THH8_HYAAI|nr:hypothetical protein HPB50_009242 [Hyalomma asiaticum]
MFATKRGHGCRRSGAVNDQSTRAQGSVDDGLIGFEAPPPSPPPTQQDLEELCAKGVRTEEELGRAASYIHQLDGGTSLFQGYWALNGGGQVSSLQRVQDRLRSFKPRCFNLRAFVLGVVVGFLVAALLFYLFSPGGEGQAKKEPDHVHA